MNRKDKVYLAMSGFVGGVSFTMIAFHLNHKDILFENPYFWAMVFTGCLGFCLKAICKEAK